MKNTRTFFDILERRWRIFLVNKSAFWQKRRFIMKFCQHCGKEILDQAVICPHCGCAASSSNNITPAKDEVNIGFCILSFLIPLFGFIFWGIKYKETPKSAKACGITALVSTIISTLALMLPIMVLLLDF